MIKENTVNLEKEVINKQEKINTNGIDIVFAILSFFLANSFINNVIYLYEGYQFLLFTVLFIIYILSYIKLKTKEIQVKALPYCVLTILSALSVAIHGYNSFFYINLILTMVLAVYTLLVATNSRLSDNLSNYLCNDLFNGFIYRPLKNFLSIFQIFNVKTNSKFAPKNLLQIILSIIFTFVMCIIVIIILSDVDQNFYNIFSNILDYIIFEINIGELYMTTLVCLYLYALVYSSINKQNLYSITTQRINKNNQGKKKIPSFVLIAPIISLTIIYVIFFISHISTIIDVLNTQNIIYSEYARQGFSQLVVISLLNLSIFAIYNIYTRKSISDEKIMKYILVGLGLCTLLIVITASIKLGLYINYYGLTIKRIHAFWALSMIFITFIILIINQFKKLNLIKYVSLIIVISYITISLIGFNTIAINYNKMTNNDINIYSSYY